ncbi:DEAD/DEAH box helicase [Brevibacillus invocatus]|uniref:DEAD/DEAH box helicase n=1 Tax=Brevibacillus invocatus TaxID=173959 RepID=UPI00203E0E22|nr:DEAD/DEAH box helicase [Brevibacillus invocatus]MCM3081337.1 DEAD/DEAH box helicase [Brevibacillus invocatus]MCM3431675.1 DEAD/DEAH box helicase [Brevibacillus invocatus]
MSKVMTLNLDAKQMADGTFLITGKESYEHPIDTEELARILFAWDEKSYYGTFIQKTDEGLVLSAKEAFTLFSNPKWLSHVTYSFSDTYQEYNQTAQLIHRSLANRAIIPDLLQWRKGRPGWKLKEQDVALPSYASLWLSLLLEEMMFGEGEVARAWEQLQSHFPALTMTGEELSPHLREQEWLQSIGWLPDLTPFRTCLQITEAEDTFGDWSLQYYLQDREKPDQLFMIEPSYFTVEGGSLADIPEAWREHWSRFLNDLQKCKEILPWYAARETGSTPLTQLNNEQAWLFLTSSSLQLVQAGIHVFLPAWWEQVRRIKPRLKAKVSSSVGTSRQSFLGISQVMDFEWKLALGPVELSEDEFESLLKQKQRLMKIRGHWVQLTPDLFQQLQETLKKNRGKQHLSLRDVMKLHLTATPEGQDADTLLDTDEPYSLSVEVELNKQLLDLMTQLQGMTSIPLSPQPATFRGTLRKYQLEGSSWLLFLRRFGLGACLADDMGLGKTVQFITYLLQLKENQETRTPSLLICPTSVIGNWQKELERFAPTLNVYIHYGNHRKKREAFLPAVDGTDLVITSYALSHLDEQELSGIQWNTICLDEAQNIKNAYTKQASAVRDLHAHHHIALTGTPIENRLTELWSIFDFLNPGYLGSLGEFNQRFVIPIERDQNKELIAQVQRLIQPFLLRRVKTDPSIQLDLPEKNEQKEYVPLTAEQGALYETTIQEMFARVENSTAMERRGLILTTLTRLKQLCDHPALILNEVTTADDVQRSHKLERLLELIGDIRHKGERCLIFTQYIAMGSMLQRILTREGYGPVFFLNGSTKKEKRDEMIELFQDSTLTDQERGAIFILSLRAGGTGLNLTEANHVIHLDRWWNPAVENQATDRAHRIGQKRNVHVYKFISLGTIEERIDEMIDRKQSLSQQIVGNSENWITELTNTELRELFTLRHDWMDTRG